MTSANYIRNEDRFRMTPTRDHIMTWNYLMALEDMTIERETFPFGVRDFFISADSDIGGRR